MRLGDDDRLCVLVMVGVRTDGTKGLIALADGYRESTESWSELLRDCKRRGMRAPVLAVGDGALGFWAAAREVFPDTRHQRDWVHKAANVLDALPTSVQAQARRALREISDAEDRTHAEAALDRFVADYARWPKAVGRLVKDREALLSFYDYPGRALDPPANLQPHRVHVRSRTPTDNATAESWMATLKCERLYDADTAAMTPDQVESMIDRFIAYYNEVRLHQSLDYVTPLERHEGRHTAIIVARKEGWEKARTAWMAANRRGLGFTPPTDEALRGSQRVVSRRARRSRIIGPCS